MMDKALETIEKVKSSLGGLESLPLYMGSVCIGLGIGTLMRQADYRNMEIVALKDFNRDGIEDIMVDAKNEGETKERYLFLGQKDGRYLKLKEFNSEDIKYFMGDDNVKYIWNGESYQKLPR